jgi:membrane protein insertase Oxa1/YidC/SpoIIIJ
VFPAGLTLYIFTNTCLSALHSIYMNKFDKKSMELTAKIQAAQAATLAAKGGGAVKNAKNANVAKAEPVRAITSGDDDADDSDDEVAEPSAKSAPRVASARQRPKKKKGRR